MPETEYDDCPLCEELTLTAHCPSPTCTWWRCDNFECLLMICPRYGRGVIPDPHVPGRYRPLLVSDD